eukprot:TRINITY_DN2338_c0_g1_i1.p1 TRINITY_DN2338_c0_g1~~TRINITY_DN2338_c0_g1_i1.p1  ORF type:complete len:169 (-),score=22.71 TRINITY_DN2338_c0_g1_i1:634-1140(-)
MGFPAECSGFIISKILFNAAFLLALVRNAFSWLLRYVGWVDVPEAESTWGDPPDQTMAASSASADMIREFLPVREFGDLAGTFDDKDDVCCAVCLMEFQKADEIRQLINCNHIFHSSCLDKWLDHDQKTCPLCRSCLVPETVENEVTAESWAVERLLYLFGEDLLFQS